MKGRLSLAALFVVCTVAVLVRWSFPQRQVLTWDVFGYYLYLPATFIHDDVALNDRAWLDEVITTYEPSATLYQLVDGPDGNRVIKYSAGMAVFYAPFFLVAHTLAEPLGYASDGFSAPYQVAIALGCLAFALFGFFVFRKALLEFFDDRWTALLLLLVGLGTNWFQLTAWDGTLLTHPALFTLYAALLLATVRWHARPTWRWALCIGACLGFITLIRPSELVAVLIPTLWSLHGAAARNAKWEAIRRNVGQLVGAVLLFLLVTSPQLIYWRTTTGQWIFYSYVNPGEGFDLDTPHLRPFLVSFRKGWFIYTPLMLLATGGLFFLWKRIPQAFWAVLLFLIVDVWIVSSWSCWWYAGGSFSSRSMVPAYVVLALPLGAVLQWAWQRRPARATASIFCIGCVALNLFQTWQWTVGIITKERMTKAYYKAVFARTSIPDGASDVLLVNRSLGGEEHLTDAWKYTGRTVFHDSFDDRPDSSLTLTAEAPFSPGLGSTYAGLTSKDHAWIRASARFWVGDTHDVVPTVVIHFEHDGGVYKYTARDWVIPAGTTHQWVPITVDYLTPEVRDTDDPMKVYVWNQHGIPMRIDELHIQVFEPE